MMHGYEKSDRCEAGEQSGAIRGGVGGAKGRDRGKCGLAKHALDSAPGSRVTSAGPHTAICLPSGPEVGAVCGKAARTDLCGGREATRVPTAKSKGGEFAVARAVISRRYASGRTRSCPSRVIGNIGRGRQSCKNCFCYRRWGF
jgi:hypothetical protein